MAIAAVPARGAAAANAPLILNDASRLDATPVRRHWRPPAPEASFIDGLRRELRDAAAAGRPVCVGGARHSMGGQSLVRDGTAITFDTGWRRADPASRTYRARAGARWREVIQTLRPLGFSPKVMQSNSDFTLGGTFSVNAHGWAAPMGPMGSTVRSVRLMLADGQIVTCSRTREPELFGLAMGGYGLFGVLLDFELDMVPDDTLESRLDPMPAAAFGPRFERTLHGPGVVMGYGRLSVARNNFLQQALMVTFRRKPGAARPAPGDAREGLLSKLTREVYRAQIGSEYWKEARWYAETTLAPRLEAKVVSRNNLLSAPVSALADHDRSRTDILHEYFLPPARLGDFLQACREVILPTKLELLNVTLRYLAPDPVSVLAYAPASRVAAVMSFAMPLTHEADEGMRRMTEVLVERVIGIGGSFYLPYRLHARRDQLERAYPRLAGFLEHKRRYDPKLLFRNTLWDHYFG
ncbi:MAG: D-arabinono,4-lactone oxidase [Phenylobacterium sp.]|nr:D-arabinono,4-lactone oxidase [Phenylobacterium sp.]